MRYRQALDGAFFNGTSTRVLRVLIRTAQPWLTGRAVARLAKAPPHRTAEVLRRLRSEGLVRKQVAGNTFLWTLNEKHPLVRPLRALYEAERRALAAQRETLCKTLRQAGGVERAVVFGSAARGDEHARSDLDLLVVAKNRAALRHLEERLNELRFDFRDKTGTRLSPLLYTAAEFRRKRGLGVIQAAEREGDLLVGPRGGER